MQHQDTLIASVLLLPGMMLQPPLVDEQTHLLFAAAVVRFDCCLIAWYSSQSWSYSYNMNSSIWCQFPRLFMLLLLLLLQAENVINLRSSVDAVKMERPLLRCEPAYHTNQPENVF